MESDDSYHFCLYPILCGINKKFTLLVCILMVIVVGGEAELVNEPTWTLFAVLGMKAILMSFFYHVSAFVIVIFFSPLT